MNTLPHISFCRRPVCRRLWELSALLGLLLFKPARGDNDLSTALNSIQGAVAEAKAAMSPTGRQAHEAEISQALAQLRDLHATLSHASVDRQAADARVAQSNNDTQTAQNELDSLVARIERETAPFDQAAKEAVAKQDAWNAQYAGKSFTIPEPLNSINATKQRIINEIDALNEKAEESKRRYIGPYRQLESTVAARKAAYQNAVGARDQLTKTLATQAQQFDSIIKELTGKLLGWVKESSPPSPGGVKVGGGEALDQLMRSYNQRHEMSSVATDRYLTRYAPAKAASNIVFDQAGGSGGPLVVIDVNGRAPAPAEMQNNTAVNALVKGLTDARDTVADAQKKWDAAIHDRSSTPQQIHEADLMLTKVTAHWAELKYEQQQATSLLGRSAPVQK